MKNILSYIRYRRLGYLLTTIAVWISWSAATMTMSGCKKDRLFGTVDSIAQVPSQFHYFNGFSYDSTMTLSIDGLPRQNVALNSFSPYFSSSSAFNLNELQPNSKLISVYDPFNTSLFLGISTIQFKPNTSYIVFAGILPYDTISRPKSVSGPQMVYLPEDTHHPYNGSTSVRLLNLTGNFSTTTLTITPNLGAGTSLNLLPVSTNNPLQIANPSDLYTNTQPGIKNLSLRLAGSAYTGGYSALFTFLPVQLNNSKAYSFILVGDMKNYLVNKEPRPKMFLVQDDDPKTLKELTISSLTYPNNATTTASVTVIDGAYNMPSVMNYTDPAGNITQFVKTTVYFNQTSTSVSRWPIFTDIGGTYEDVGNTKDLTPPNKLVSRISSTLTLQPNSYLVRVLPGNAFSPLLTSFNYDFQQGLQYTVCLVPSQTSSTTCGQLVLQNDNKPDPAAFRLRIINLMGGVPAVDVHLNAPNGPVIAAAVPFNQANDYVTFPANFVNQNLYITAPGSTTALFQTGAKNKPIAIPFKSGNSGTIYLMGLLPGVPYSGDGSAYPPFVYYSNDAYFSSTSVNTNQILFY